MMPHTTTRTNINQIHNTQAPNINKRESYVGNTLKIVKTTSLFGIFAYFRKVYFDV